MNDWELIQNYCRNGSESAFETLVKRHVDYVYCAALSQVRDPSLAEDVSQAVFLLLARKAKSFRSGTVLVSWLFRTTHYIAGCALRSEYRRQRRELEAAKMNPTITTSETDHEWEQVSPLLNEALAALPNKDRDAVLLRFISRKPFSQVGAEIGVSEDAAKKRVSRALVRLKEFFTRRGTTLSVAVIATLLGERFIQASPAALATKISAIGSGAIAAASSPAAALLKTTLRELFWTKVKWGAAISAGVVTALLVAASALRPIHNQPTSSSPLTPPAQRQTSIDSKLAAADDANKNENTTNHLLSLSVVRSEDRKPIPRARVLVDGWDGKNQKRMLDASTDGNGLLNIPIPTNDFSQLSVWVSAEDRVPMLVNWQPHEFNEPVLPYTLLLEAGQTASGTVVDQFGEPIPGAAIYFQTFESGGGYQTRREHRAFNQGLPPLYTDVNGRWTTTQFPPPAHNQGVMVRVTSPAYAPLSVQTHELATNLVVVLSNGVALSGRITAADGKPIQHATVTKSGVYMNIQTDAEGRFSWPHIEGGQVFLDVEADGFETVHELVWATNASNDCAFTLQPSSNSTPVLASQDGPKVLLRGTVVDADTGQPIPFFKVFIGDGPAMPNWGPDAALPDARLFGEGHDGRFSWNIGRRGGFRLEVLADGYLASNSDERNDKNAGDEFIFKLHPATLLAGRVLTPDGLPARHADLTLTGPNLGGVMQRPGQLIEPNSGFEDARTRTDNEGRFQLRLKAGARGIAIVHPRGTALLTFEAATNAPVVLQPWGIVEGTLYLNGEPAPGQNVTITGTQQADADPRITLFFVYGTNTDAQGKFRFDKVLPGTHSIERWVTSGNGSGQAVVNSDHHAKVEVKSGMVTTVDLRQDGRPVIGHIAFQEAPEDIDWGMSEGSLVGKNKYPFALSKDGAIRADDVPPGNYTLSIELKLVTVSPQMYQKTFGSLQKQVIVPSADNASVPVNLGDLTIERAK